MKSFQVTLSFLFYKGKATSLDGRAFTSLSEFLQNEKVHQVPIFFIEKDSYSSFIAVKMELSL